MMSTARHLTVRTVLEYCDGPLLFLAEDAAETTYACSFLSSANGTTDYLCSRMAPSVLRRFLNGGVDLRSAILDAKLPDNLLLRVADDQDEDMPLIAEPIPDIQAIDQSLLPAEGYFVAPEIGHPLLSSEYAAIEASLDISEAKLAPVISSYALAEFIKIFQDLIKAAYKKAISGLPQHHKQSISSPEFYTAQVSGMGAHASFSIQFRSKQATDLSQHVEFERALNKTEQILERAGDIAATIEILKLERGHLVGAFRRLLGFLLDTESSLRLQWHAPSSGDIIKRFAIGLDYATAVQSALSKMEDLGDELMDFEGIIFHVNTESGSWALRADDGSVHRGKIEDGKRFSLGGIVVKTTRYKLRCKEHLVEDALGRETRTLLLYEPPILLPPTASGQPL